MTTVLVKISQHYLAIKAGLKIYEMKDNKTVIGVAGINTKHQKLLQRGYSIYWQINGIEVRLTTRLDSFTPSFYRQPF